MIRLQRVMRAVDMTREKRDQKASMERLAQEVQQSLDELEVYLGAESARALQAYITSQIALLTLDFKALATQSEEEELGVTPASRSVAETNRAVRQTKNLRR